MATAIFAAGLALLGGYYVMTLPDPAPVEEVQLSAEHCDLDTALASAPRNPVPGGGAPGPFLALCVGGEAEGVVVIDLNERDAPAHAERLETLARNGAYDTVAFHRVIDGFMAQTGDVEFGVAGGDMGRVGSGGSALPDLPAEFSAVPFTRGTVGMARSQNPNSANSQFFIMFDRAAHLDGQYTVVGEVVSGMEVVDAIKRGGRNNGAVQSAPDRILAAAVAP